MNELSQPQIEISIVIRPCLRADVRKLEWFGKWTPHRSIIEAAFARTGRGEVLMLVADLNGFPVGQAWVDLSKKGQASIGILWAVRVMPFLQNYGIGTRLIWEAERSLREANFATAEIGVEKANVDARRLYERLGYRIVGTDSEPWYYTTPEGAAIRVEADEWTLQKAL